MSRNKAAFVLVDGDQTVQHALRKLCERGVPHRSWSIDQQAGVNILYCSKDLDNDAEERFVLYPDDKIAETLTDSFYVVLGPAVVVRADATTTEQTAMGQVPPSSSGTTTANLKTEHDADDDIAGIVKRESEDSSSLMVSDPATGQASASSRGNVKVKKEKDAGGDHIMTSHKQSSNSVAAVVKTEKGADDDDIRGNVKQEPQAVPPMNGSSQNKKHDIAMTSQARNYKKARTSTNNDSSGQMTQADHENDDPSGYATKSSEGGIARASPATGGSLHPEKLELQGNHHDELNDGKDAASAEQDRKMEESSHGNIPLAPKKKALDATPSTNVANYAFYYVNLPITKHGLMLQIGPNHRSDRLSSVVFFQYIRGPNGEKGVAELQNSFKPDDEIVTVDGVQCYGLSYNNIVSLLKAPTSNGIKKIHFARYQSSALNCLVKNRDGTYKPPKGRRPEGKCWNKYEGKWEPLQNTIEDSDKPHAQPQNAKQMKVKAGASAESQSTSKCVASQTMKTCPAPRSDTKGKNDAPEVNTPKLDAKKSMETFAEPGRDAQSTGSLVMQEPPHEPDGPAVAITSQTLPRAPEASFRLISTWSNKVWNPLRSSRSTSMPPPRGG